MNRSLIFEQIRSKKSFLCVGLDSEITRIPKHLFAEDDPVFAFNKAIIDATAAFTVAYKPNTAFYEANGSKGWRSLESTISYIRINYPEMFIIADAKRGDIGNTSDNYASAFFKHLDADAVTVAPYMGFDSVHPFLGYSDKWVVLLVLTSNSGSADFQHLTDASGSPLFEIVLKKAASWATPDQMMFVAGATYPDAILRIRALVPDYFLLVPGVGAQGGDLETVAKNGLNSQGGLLINASRSIIYASSGTDFDAAAANEAKKMQQMMEKALLHKGLI